MKRTILIGFTMLAATTLSSLPALAADPTLHQVYQAAEAGNLKQAESMMDQVLRDHPNSAKAHFVEAQLLAREGRIASARAELATAERLAPGLPFAKQESVRELTARINAPVRTGAPAAAVSATGSPSRIPWGMLMLGGLLVAAILFFIRSLRRPAVPSVGAGVPAYGSGGMAQPYGAGGAMPTPPAAGGMGSGILGGLATGAAVGAGLVAGEALMHKVLDGGQQGNGPLASPMVDPVQPDYDMGGSDFGIADGTSWDDAPAGGGDDWS
jgi:hypothetical protein